MRNVPHNPGLEPLLSKAAIAVLRRLRWHSLAGGRVCATGGRFQYTPTSSLFSLLCANIQDMIFEVPAPDALLPVAMPTSHNVIWDFPLYTVITTG